MDAKASPLLVVSDVVNATPYAESIRPNAAAEVEHTRCQWHPLGSAQRGTFAVDGQGPALVDDLAVARLAQAIHRKEDVTTGRPPGRGLRVDCRRNEQRRQRNTQHRTKSHLQTSNSLIFY